MLLLLALVARELRVCHKETQRPGDQQWHGRCIDVKPINGRLKSVRFSFMSEWNRLKRPRLRDQSVRINEARRQVKTGGFFTRLLCAKGGAQRGDEERDPKDL